MEIFLLFRTSLLVRAVVGIFVRLCKTADTLTSSLEVMMISDDDDDDEQ